MNPFKNRHLKNREDWFGNQDIFNKLDFSINYRTNTCIIGVKGVGKTTLLNCFFTFEYRKQMALEKQILIFSADLSTRTDGDDVCNYLADQLKFSIKRLLRGSNELAEIIEALDDIETRTGNSKLSETIDILHEYQYFIVLVMDNFELFTSSLNITMEHHGILRSLIEAEKLQCIVATNYDLTEDSLPKHVKGSYLIHKFTDSILVPPFSEKDAITFIQMKQKESPIRLEEQTISMLYGMSGGIPWLLETAADCIYDKIEANDVMLDEYQIKDIVYRECYSLLQSWCKLLTISQINALKILVSQIKDENKLASWDFTGEQLEMRQAVSTLKERGILQNTIRTDKFGNPHKSPEYEVRFNSLLLQKFCNDGGLEISARKNPLVQTNDFLGNNSLDTYNNNEATGTIIHVHGDMKVDNSIDNSQTLQIDNMQIVQGISASKLIKMLGDSAEPQKMLADQLSNQIKRALPEGIIGLDRQSDMSDEEFAQRYDYAFNQASCKIIQDVDVDEEEDIVDVTPEELQTLDMRFNEARLRCRDILSDELLETQSERCQFYLKLAVIVEDALNFPNSLFMNDFSPQLVLYGKAFELTLRDNLYDLFHEEPKLSEYNYNKNSLTDRFKNKLAHETYIGNYAFLIAGMKAHLGKLCMENNLSLEKKPLLVTWIDWWDKLQFDIHQARVIRNLSDHADDRSPSKIDLDEMCELLFGIKGEDGIIGKVVVGRKLFLQLNRPNISVSHIQLLEGTEREIECTHLKDNGGIKGVICNEGYEVNISPRKVQKYKMSTSGLDFQPVGKKYLVKLLEHKKQNRHEFFSAEIIAEV